MKEKEFRDLLIALTCQEYEVFDSLVGSDFHMSLFLFQLAWPPSWATIVLMEHELPLQHLCQRFRGLEYIVTLRLSILDPLRSAPSSTYASRSWIYAADKTNRLHLADCFGYYQFCLRCLTRPAGACAGERRGLASLASAKSSVWFVAYY